MAGFAKDVVTPIEIPTVQTPDFTANRSTVQNISSIVSFGIALNDRIEAKDKELARQTVERDMNKFVDTLVVDFLNNTEQPGGRQKALRSTQTSIAQRGTPLQSSFINKAFGERLKVLEQGVDFSAKARTQDAFSVAGSDMQSDALATLNLNNVPESGTRARDQLNTVVNQITSIGITYDTNKKIAQNAENVSKNQIDDLDISMRRVMSTKGEPLITKMTELLEQAGGLPSGERAAVLNGIRENLTIFKGTLQGFVDDTFAGVPSTKTIKNKEEALKEIDRLIKPLEDADDEAFGIAAKNLQFLSSDLQLGLFNAGNALTLIKAANGAAIPELTWSFIQQNQSLADDLLGAVKITLGLTDAQANAMTIKSLHDYIGGGGSLDDIGEIPLSPEQKSKIYETSFKFLKSKTRDGELMNLAPEDSSRVADSMIHVLQDASSKDPVTSGNIMGWASDPNFQEVLKNIDPEKADAVRNMIITKSKESLRLGDGTQKVINQFPDMVTFSPNSGRFTLTSKGESLPRRIGTGLLAGAGPVDKPTVLKAVKDANRDIDTFLTNSVANPALKGLTQQQKLSWLMKEGSGIPLSPEVALTNGKFVTTTGDQTEAIEQQISVQELEKRKQEIIDRASIPSQVLELQDEIKQLRSQGVDQPAEADLSDLDDEEFAEFIRQERKRRGLK